MIVVGLVNDSYYVAYDIVNLSLISNRYLLVKIVVLLYILFYITVSTIIGE